MTGNTGDNNKKSFHLVIGGYFPRYREVQWHTRGYIPHCEDWQKVQPVTFRLADALPRHVVERMLHDQAIRDDDAERRKKVEAFLDAGHGECRVKDSKIASRIREMFLHYNGHRDILHAWVIMPNHIHILFEAIEPFSLSRIVKDWKSFTAHAINRIVGATGKSGMKNTGLALFAIRSTTGTA